MHVHRIDRALVSRSTQATARVAVLGGTGEPVAGVAVTAKWSGPVNKGDASKTTATDGTLFFCSARYRPPCDVCLLRHRHCRGRDGV
jgi:hypothetical protein